MANMLQRSQPRPASRPPKQAAIAGLLRDLQCADVRSLAALVASPQLLATRVAPIASLTDAWRLDSLLTRRDWLCVLDAHPAELAAHLAGSNARHLGRYAEALWQFWLAHMPGARLYASGLPVKDGTAVRGEFDFIVALPGLPGIQHLEMGYKFYLYCPPGTDWSRMFGPNPIDRLDRKWQHMLDAQLPLSQTMLGRSALPPGVSAVEPRACLQGWLFYPLTAPAPADIEGLSPAHWRGWWCRCSELDNGACARWTALAEAWTILPRLSWIAPATVRDQSVLLSSAQCREGLGAHFAVSSQAQLIAGLSPGDDSAWHESVRVFVVARDWPKAH